MIYDYAMLSVNNFFYVIGGFTGQGPDVEFSYINGYTNKIGRLNKITKNWTLVGELQSARSSHSAVFYDSYFLVIGGNIGYIAALATEKCNLIDDQITCTSQTPYLDDYSDFGTFIVPFDFCQ